MKLGRTKVGDIKLIFFLAEQISIANFPSQNIARVNLPATDEMVILIFQVRIATWSYCSNWIRARFTIICSYIHYT